MKLAKSFAGAFLQLKVLKVTRIKGLNLPEVRIMLTEDKCRSQACNLFSGVTSER